MDYNFKEVIDAFVELCCGRHDFNWCEGDCPLYKKYGDECSTLVTMSDYEGGANEWARIVMDWKEQNS